MTNADRQARFRKRRQEELERLKALGVPADWHKGKSPEEIAELDNCARKIREGDELCQRANELERQGLLEIKAVARDLLKAYRELIDQYNKLVDDYNELLGADDDEPIDPAVT
jgi:hypothetical protein